MADHTWPATLPDYDEVAITGYGETLPDLLVPFETDSGYPILRREFTAKPIEITVQLWLKDTANPATSQVDILEDFYLTTTLGGAEAFDWNRPRTGVAVEMMFIPGTPPSWVPRGNDWFLGTMGLWILP